jgi:hypothetical protein
MFPPIFERFVVFPITFEDIALSTATYSFTAEITGSLNRRAKLDAVVCWILGIGVPLAQ